MSDPNNLPAVTDQQQGGLPSTINDQALRTVDEILQERAMVMDLMTRAMKEDEHYGVIPGTRDKRPTLLQPGAQLLSALFRLVPEYDTELVNLEGDHRIYTITCRLLRGGVLVGSGLGMCSSMESKYRYRYAQRACPSCGKTTIIRSKYRDEWVCLTTKDGCGNTYNLDDPLLTRQDGGKVENPDVADTWNTILKMAVKRSLVAAVLTATCASETFTQDLEDQVPPTGSADTAPRNVTPAADPAAAGSQEPAAQQVAQPAPAPQRDPTRVPLIERIGKAVAKNLFTESEQGEIKARIKKCNNTQLLDLAKDVEAEVAKREQQSAQRMKEAQAELDPNAPTTNEQWERVKAVLAFNWPAAVRGKVDTAQGGITTVGKAAAFLGTWESLMRNTEKLADLAKEAEAEAKAEGEDPRYWRAYPFRFEDESWGARVKVPKDGEIKVGQIVRIHPKNKHPWRGKVTEIVGYDKNDPLVYYDRLTAEEREAEDNGGLVQPELTPAAPAPGDEGVAGAEAAFDQSADQAADRMFQDSNPEDDTK